jgi:prepilin-type processing-associated H-X9-DG protein
VRSLAVTLVLAATACGPAGKAPANAACHPVSFEDTAFTDCIADPARDRIRLVIEPRLRTLGALADTIGDPANVRFAMNGGMYDVDGKAIGLAVSDSRQVHPLNRKRGGGNFHLLPNGVFSAEVDGWHVRTSDAYAAARLRPLTATQSGPMLVIDVKLHPAFSPDGDSHYIRNAVGIDRSGKAHFVISQEPVSFGRIARLFRDRLNCANALFLDGSVSALWDPAASRIDSTVGLGPLLVVETRANR